MNEQLLKDFIATAQKYNYNWNKAFGLFPELKGYDQQLLKDYVATAEKNNYDYKKVNSLFPELGFNQEPLKKKDSTVLESKLEKPTSGSSSRRFEGVTEEPISQKKVRTDDYIDQVQNTQKKLKTTGQNVESTFEQPKETKPPIKFEGLSDKEANKMMAEDFGKKEFAAYSSINEIPSSKKLRDLDEETTANILNKQFEGTNLKFKKIGSQLTVTSKIGYGINSTILNESTIDLSDPNADKKLKSFVSTNLVKKSEREQFENAQSVEDLVELVGSNPNKFKASLLEGMNVDSYFERERQLLNGEMTRAKADTYDSDLKSYEQKVAKFNQDVKGGKMSKADFDARSAQLENERNSLTQRRDIMSSVIRKAEKIDKLTNNLEDAKVITAAEREKQGSLMGLVLRGVGEGLTDVSQAMIDFGIAGAAAVTDAKTLADAITPGEYERLKELGFSDDEIKNEIQKSVKNRANKVLRSIPDAFGMGTTEEYAKSADRGIIDQAIYAVGESFGAVGGGLGAGALGSSGVTAGFFAMSYNALEDQMRGPQFDALSENEKKIMSVPYGLVIGALEKLGAKVATGAAKNKTLGMFSEYIMAKTFSSLPKNASLLEIKSAINKSVALSVANGMLKITGAGIVEGGTEFTQQIFEGIEKDVANRIIQSNQLDKAKEEGGGTVSKEIYNQIVQNKFFKDAADLSTTEGIGQLLKESGNAFLVGAVAGGMTSSISVGVAEPISNKVSNNRFATYRDIILNDDAREGAISSINKKVENDQLTREEADEQIKSINESYPALRQIPTEFSVGAQREAFGLLMERESLNREIEGKDPNLVAKQKERVAEINEQLKGLSYAVQEQSTGEVPVQPTTGVGTEMEERVPGTETQGVIGETITEEVEVEGPKAEQPQAEVAQEIVQSEENQTLIDAYVQEQTEFINGVNFLNQEEKQELIDELVSDPIAYAEKYRRFDSEIGGTPHTDLLNSLQRQPASQETVVTEETQQPITQDEIETRRKETEAKIKNKDLFLASFDENGNKTEASVGEKISQSNVAPVATSVREINGIEFVEFSNPETADVDVVITGKKDGSYVGYYRLYDKSKVNGEDVYTPTNKWSSKFQNTGSKEDFKTMIGGVQEMLPADHEWTEKTSISTDGLRTWNQQLNRGYELQYDENGNVVTDEVAINGDAIVNQLGIPEERLERGKFANINVTSQAEFQKVKEALLPYLEKLGLNESNVRWMSGPLKNSGTVKIDLPVLKPTTQQAEVVQETVQPTAQAQPTAKIETIEVQEVPQVDQTLNDLTQQNNVITQNDFTAAKVRNVGKEKVVAQIAKAAKAIAKVLPKVKIVVHATPEAFVEATKDMDGRLSEGGLYDQQTGEIHINLERANNRTVAHEVFHALILSRVNTDLDAQRLTRSMIGAVRKSLKKAEGTAELISYLEDFESNYDENIKNEEKLAELFGILADNYKQLPPASKNVIIRFLNRLAKAFGLKEMTDREAIAFMNTLSRKVETGQEIEAREVGKQKEGKAAVRKQIIGEVGAKKLDQQENSNLRMDNLKVANDMKDAGKTPKEIRTATGWEMGAEGKWRYETVDNLPFFKDTVRAIKEMQAENNLTFLNNVPANLVIPQELIKMYPELNDYTVDFGTGNENEGNVNFDKKRIEVNIGLYPKNTVSTLLHEIQHVIQEIEGFDSGTNTQEIIDEFIAKDNALKNRINRIKKNSPDSPLLDAVRKERKAFIDNFSTVNKNNERVLDKFNLYMRKAGEIEARNVESRMNMTAEERRNTLLTETEDVKERQVIEDRVTGKFAVRKQKGDVVKSKIDEDWEHTITLNGKKIGKIWYDKSQKTWNNIEFDRRSVNPNTYQWVYGDVVGETKQEAIDEMVRRYKEKESKPIIEAKEAKIKYTNDQVTNSFLNALNEKSDVSKNPIDNKSFIYGDKASLEFSRFDKGDRNEIAIQSISTFDKGKGVGKQVMKDITDTADELGVTLTLDAKPFGNEGLSKEQLINFYKNNGFVADIEEMFGGEFESEEELIDYVINEEPDEALQMTREPSTREFAVRKQKTTGPSRIVENGVKAGKTDAEIRQEGKAAGFTNKEMTEALSKYYTKEQGIFMKSGIKGFVGRFVDGARKFKQKYLTSKGLLAKIGFTYKEKMEGEISAESNRAAKTAKKFGVLFNKFTGDKDLLLKAFDKVLRGDKSIQLPAGFARLANEMRNHIDRLSQMLIDSGAVDADMADTIRDNMGTYITRSYEIFDNKNFRQKVGEQELQAAKNFLKTQPGMIALAQAEAARTGVTVDEALDALVDNKIDEYFADAETGALVKGSKLGSKDLSTLKERKEIPEQIRMLMGEYSDPAMNYARTVLNIASLAARHQFLTQVKEAGMGKFFFEKNDSQRPKGFDTEIASEGSDTMSPLNGLMTTPEIAEAFGLYNGQKGEDSWIQQVFKLYYKAMGLVKWLKTIASVSTHMKNIFGNFGFVGLNGHSLIEIAKASKVVAQDLKTMSKPEVEAKIDEYIKAGIMRQGAGINEIRDMFKDADMDGFLERRLSMRKPKGVMGKIKQGISSKASKLKTAMEDLYQAEDDMFKIAAYETEMNRYADALYDKSKDQLTDKERQEVSDIAANNVKNTYPTYSRIPEGIKQLRKFPLFIGSFISFQAESYRTAYNTIGLAKDELSSDNKKIKAIGARRVVGALSYLTAKKALLYYTGYAAKTGIGGVLGALFDDDDEKKKEKDVRSFLPPWSQNSDIIVLKAADGEIEYIDFSASDPHGGINKALNALFRREDMVDSFKQSMLELIGQFEGPDILTNLAKQLYNNKNDFDGKIYNEEDDRENKIDKILDYVYKVVEPGTATSIRKAVASEQSLGQIAFGEATGLKIRKVNVKDQFGYKLPEFNKSFEDARSIYNSEYYKSIKLSEDPKATKKDIQEQNKKTDEAFVRANKKYAAKAKELMDLINSANRLGVDYDELINELGFIKSTMGKSNISEMENGGDEFIKEKDY